MNRPRQYSGLNLYRKQQPAFNASTHASRDMAEIPPEGPIIDAKYRWVEDLDILAYVDQTEMLPENKALVKAFVHDARLGKTIKKKSKKKVGKSRQIKYVQDLKKLDAHFKKNFKDVAQEEMECFILDLEDGKLIQKNGKPYAAETQVAIKKIVIKFYKWLHGSPDVTPSIVSWIDTSCELKDHIFLTRAELDTMLSRMVSNSSEQVVRNKALIAVLFDTGLRANELLNLRVRDLEYHNEHYKIRVTVSKTLKRTLVLTLSRKYVDEWLDVYPNRTVPEAQLFPISYTALAHMIERTGKRISKHVTPHTLRHSSITYWANHLKHAQLCMRFGWSMNSKQPARYIQRAGIEEEAVAELYNENEAKGHDEEKEMLYRRLAMMEEQMNKLLEGDLAEIAKLVKNARE